ATATVTASLTASATGTASATPVTGLRTRDMRVTNVSEGTFTVSWTTDLATTGAVRWSTASGSPSTIAHDIRGAATVSTVHSVTVSGLLPATRYLFDVVSGDGTDTNGGLHFPVLTGASLPIPTPDIAFGSVRSAAGAVAQDALVVLTIDAPGGGSSVISTMIRPADGGTWLLNLSNLRTTDRTAQYPYTSSATITVEAIGGVNGYARGVLSLADARAGTGSIQLATVLETSLQVSTGWNLVSLALEPSTPMSASSLCSAITSLAEIDRWDGGWEPHLCNIPANDFPLEVGRGYFLRASASRTWSYQGLPASGRLTFALQSGWNLIALPGANLRYDAPAIVASIDLASGSAGAVREIARWEASAWESHIQGVPLNRFPIEEGRGYFVGMTRPVAWAVPALTGTNRVRITDAPTTVPSGTTVATTSPSATTTSSASPTGTVVSSPTPSSTPSATPSPAPSPSGATPETAPVIPARPAELGQSSPTPAPAPTPSLTG
ncbi:MAG: fibronectin type III domain-containing protein, partial [Actinomycetota bacterium]